MGVLCAPLLLPDHRREKGVGDEGHHRDLARSGASSITRAGVSLAPLAQRAAAARAALHDVALTRASRPLPTRDSTAPFSTRPSRPRPPRSSTTSLRRVPCGRSPRVLSPRRPHAPLSASWSTAAHALVDGASLGALRSPLLRSESPARHLGVRRGCARAMREAARVVTAWDAEALAIARAARVAAAWTAWRDGRADRTGRGRENFSKRDAVEDRDERGRAGGGERRRGGTR
jgi:hypothetical protein